MATFDEHIQQAKSNISFLLTISNHNQKYWDWCVTTCFYTSVHLINAHISKTANQHYRTHESVNNAISPFNSLSPAKLSEDLYLSYNKLQNLSRRARYLCHDDPTNRDTQAFITNEKHFEKAIYHLDCIMNYISQNYKIKFDQVKINIARTDLKYFKKAT